MPTVYPFSAMPAVLNATAGRVQRNATRIVQKVASTAHRELVLATPVDTGKARSNWIVAVDGPFNAVIPPYAPGRFLGRGERANANAAIAQGKGPIGRFDARVNRSVHISNNTPYIGVLNTRVHSLQTAPGFVERSLLVAAASIQGIKILDANP